jgi:endonuclease-3
MNKSDRYNHILDYFRQQPRPTTELEFQTTYQLLVAVVLSAQCTDKRVNMVTPALFHDFPTVQTMADADEGEIFEYIKSISYPNAKAHHLVEAARIIVNEYNGEVPSDMDLLLRLPGVGRKTANVIQAVAFGKAAMAVDTHIYRVSHRLGLVRKTDNNPYKVELELKKNIPEEDIPDAHHWLLLHGRYICTSLKPKCDKCPFYDICPKLLENSKLR